MSVIALAFMNLWRRPLRALLTVIGIAMASGGGLAIPGLIQGVQASLERGMDEQGVDLVVSERASFSLVGGSVAESLAPRLSAVEGVDAVAGVLFNILSADDSAHIAVAGWPLPSFLWQSLHLRSGRIPRPDEKWAAVLGDSVAEALGKQVGDTVTIHYQDYEVVGIAAFESFLNRNLAIVPFAGLQELMNRRDSVTFFQVRLQRPLDAQRLDAIRTRLQAAAGHYAIYQTSELVGDLRLIAIINAVAGTVSVMMMGLTLFLVANTLIMAVHERTYDIGVLMALGWPDRRILSLILIEGLVMAALGAALGIALSWVAMDAASRSSLSSGYLQVHMTWVGVVTMLAATLLAGVVGALYPAWQATRLDPAEALRRQ